VVVRYVYRAFILRGPCFGLELCSVGWRLLSGSVHLEWFGRLVWLGVMSVCHVDGFSPWVQVMLVGDVYYWDHRTYCMGHINVCTICIAK